MKFLKKKGYGVIAKNWRSQKEKRSELDLVCKQADHLVFVEVRARKKNALVNGYDSLSYQKRRALKKSIKRFLIESPKEFESHRLDFVEVDLPGWMKSIICN